MLKPHEKHFVGNVVQKAIIRKDGKILLIQYPEDKIKHSNPRAWQKWDMPGGRLNIDENPEDGFRRELLEEVGLDVVIRSILTTGIYISLVGNPIFFLVYDCILKDENQTIKFNDGEAEIVRWVEPTEFFTLPMIYPEYQEALKPVLL